MTEIFPSQGDELSDACVLPSLLCGSQHPADPKGSWGGGGGHCWGSAPPAAKGYFPITVLCLVRHFRYGGISFCLMNWMLVHWGVLIFELKKIRWFFAVG